MHTSPRSTCATSSPDPRLGIDPALAGREVYTIIWTTTPWTLPASLAVAFHPDFEYVALDCTTQASGCPRSALGTGLHRGLPLWPRGPAETACKLGDIARRFKGDRLDRATFQHPFLDRSILGVNATYVTADQGTGAVHTAPAHGADDFYTGQRYGLDPTCRVDNAGHPRGHRRLADAEPPAFEGKRSGPPTPSSSPCCAKSPARCWPRRLEHSYPHCWRCHKPVIFRATEQWFIGLETPVERADGSKTTFRQLAIEEIDKVSGTRPGARSASPT
jgi:isoleucyl-tRNA synthetase